MNLHEIGTAEQIVIALDNTHLIKIILNNVKIEIVQCARDKNINYKKILPEDVAIIYSWYVFPPLEKEEPT